MLGAVVGSATASVFPDGLNHPDPGVRAAIAAVTTTASDTETFRLIDPLQSGINGGGTPGATLIEASQLVGLPEFRNSVQFAGIDGSGYAVVIIDSGIDGDHPFFGPDSDGNGVADRIVYRADFVTPGGAGEDQHGHGTHVSSIVASEDATYGGVAPGVNIIHLRVLNSAGNGTAAAIESALQWVVANAAAYNIAAVNMSLGFSDNHTSAATLPALGLTDELAAIAAQDVMVVSSSGNAFFAFASTPGVAYPSADPNSLSIGAVWDADAGGPYSWAGGAQDLTTGVDRITSFSQRNPSLTTIFAPGAPIIAAAIGGGVATLSGTSMSAPFITGVAALAQQLSVQLTGERLSLSEFAELLKQTGVPIFDGDDEDDNVTNTQSEYRRLDILALGNAIASGGWSDVSIPGGLRLDAASAPAGGQTRVDFTIVNQGASSTGTFVSQFYLSTDSTIDASDIPVASVTDDIAAGQTAVRHGFAVPLPADLPAGDYFLGIVLDDGANVAEGNELNNVSVIPITLAEDSAEIWLVDAVSGVKISSDSGIVDFGMAEQGVADATKTFRITNDGTIDLILGEMILPAGYAAEGFPTAVAPLATSEFTISLISAGDLGTFAGTVSFSTNDAEETAFEFSATGVVIVADDHGNDAEHATAVGLPTFRSGYISLPHDVDWFQFSAEEGAEYTIETILGTLDDSVIRVYAGDGTTLLAMDDDGGAGLASRLVFAAPGDGDYFVEVASKAGGLGGYYLTIKNGDDHGNQPLDGTLLKIPATTEGAIEHSGDVDWFALEAVPDVAYRIEVALGTLPGVQVRVVAPDGVTELAKAVGVEGLPAIVNWTTTERDTYFIEVIGFEEEEPPSDPNDPSSEIGEVQIPGGPTGSYQIVASAASVIPGDYNFDAIVDGADFLAWQRTLGTGGPTSPSPLDSKGFEDYVPGPLHKQNGWVQLGPRSGSATVQSEVVAQGSQAVRVERTREVDNWWGVPLGDGAALGPLVLVQWDMRVTATEDPEVGAFGPFFGVQAYDGEGPIGLLGSLGVDATTLDVMYQQSGDGVLVETGVMALPDVWYSFALLLDFDFDEFTVFFEGQALATSSFVDLGVAGVELDRLTDADIAALAAQMEVPSQRITGTAYFDNFRILNAVPSPMYPADGNGDGVVDGLDLTVWRGNYGVSYASAAGGEMASASVTPHPPASAGVSATAMAGTAEFSTSQSSQPSTLSFAPLAQWLASAERMEVWTDFRIVDGDADIVRSSPVIRDRALLQFVPPAERALPLAEFDWGEVDGHQLFDDDWASGDAGDELDAALVALFG